MTHPGDERTLSQPEASGLVDIGASPEDAATTADDLRDLAYYGEAHEAVLRAARIVGNRVVCSHKDCGGCDPAKPRGFWCESQPRISLVAALAARPGQRPEPSDRAIAAGAEAGNRFGIALSDSGFYAKIEAIGKAMYAVDFRTRPGQREGK